MGRADAGLLTRELLPAEPSRGDRKASHLAR